MYVSINRELKIPSDNHTKIFNINGNEISQDDFYHIKNHDIFYVTRKGRPINWQSYLSCYEKIKRLGAGGFGTVYLMKHKIN